MALIDKFEKKFRNFGIPNVTLYLVFGQAFVYVMAISGHEQILGMIELIPTLVLRGEVWRLFTFVFTPRASHPIFLFFALYIFYLMGSSLENYWGTARYNVFLLIGYLATTAVSFLSPDTPASVTFLAGSVFLAFATLNPGFRLMLFFMFPIEIRWLALLTWILYALQLFAGPWPVRLLIMASLCNYLVFFARDIALRIRAGRWRMERQIQEAARQNQPTHRCIACGVTDKDHPDMSFRYCTKCAGTPCYCQDHIKNHEHIPATESRAQ
ncbi:hypothetical protein CSB45_06510 [candidate division KSB3 bacterium]|uniref:Peptidase S54 rhomboid domain-containing protein n=1 Tax=candidate division KSB3 bacterium TaxID=2044937 RepID=A0A2G6E724_9BACT|nr:MAG: hypothetical protein CSB45_06510 [candidate division KSB3 bacterium]PIE30315.1 MAG: hypothetical protein CSA57_05225 [candidate division KSB3 bacterium]